LLADEKSKRIELWNIADDSIEMQYAEVIKNQIQ
jgi:hypothetical protein